LIGERPESLQEADMPFMEGILPRLNRLLTQDAIGDFPARVLDGAPTLVELLREIGAFERDGEADFVSQIPPSIQEALIAILRSNLRRDVRKQMIVSWAPGYDWELTVWETASTSASRGGITMQIKSRYPADTHPARASREARAATREGDEGRRWRQ
jgi:hypothetical protein